MSKSIFVAFLPSLSNLLKAYTLFRQLAAHKLNDEWRDKQTSRQNLLMNYNYVTTLTKFLHISSMNIHYDLSSACSYVRLGRQLVLRLAALVIAWRQMALTLTHPIAQLSQLNSSLINNFAAKVAE